MAEWLEARKDITSGLVLCYSLSKARTPVARYEDREKEKETDPNCFVHCTIAWLAYPATQVLKQTDFNVLIFNNFDLKKIKFWLFFFILEIQNTSENVEPAFSSEYDGFEV